MAVQPQSTGTDLIAMYERALQGAKALVGSLQPDDFGKPTPCESWDVSALVNHMVTTNRRFAAALSGEQFAPGPPATGSELQAAYQASADEGLRAWHAPGALDRTLNLPSGQVPATTGIGMIFVDQLIHTWDLSKALGRGEALPDDLAGKALELSRARVTPDRRGPGKPYGPEIPCAENAPVQDRLAAFLGRQP